MSGSGEMTQQYKTNEWWDALQQLAYLPAWLEAARHPQNVCEAMQRAVPEFSSGRLILEACDVGHMRFKRDFWIGTYEFMVREPGKDEVQTIPLRGTTYPPGVEITAPEAQQVPFGSPEWSIYLPGINLVLKAMEPETVLSSMELLTDPEEVCKYLEASVRASTPHYRDISFQRCRLKVVRYKPGSRCTILYWPEYPDGQAEKNGWPHLIVAKTYRSDKGQVAYDGMQALWSSPLSSSDRVTIAEPLAYDPERRVLLQGPIREEQTLKELMYWWLKNNTPEAYSLLEEFLRKTAAALAAVHNSGVQYGPAWNWEDRASEIRDRIGRLGDAFPQVGHALDPMLARLADMASSSTPDPVVPSHGSFRPAQVLLHQGQIGFIDFDSFSQSEPALDLALFLATLMSIGVDTSKFGDDPEAAPMEGAALDARMEQVLALSEAFLDEYERYHPVSRQRVALWQSLDITMLVLQSWIKVKTFRLQDSVYLLEKHLKRMGFIHEV